MNKKLLITFLTLMILVIGALNVSASYGLSISTTNSTYSVNDGSSINSKLNMVNTGTDNITASIFLTTNEFSIAGDHSFDAISFSNDLITEDIAAGKNINTSIILTVPSAQYAGTYTGKINADFVQNGNFLSATKAFDIVVAKNPTLDVQLPSTITVKKGESKTAILEIINTGNTDLTNVAYRIGEGSLLLANVPYQTQKNITINLDTTIVGSTQLKVWVQNPDESDLTKYITVVVTEEVKDFTLTDTDGSLSFNRNSNVLLTNNDATITLTNNGNAVLNPSFSMVTRDLVFGVNSIPSSSISFTQSPAGSLAVGNTKVLTIKVNPSNTLPSGTYSGVFTITIDGVEKNATVSYIVNDAEKAVTISDLTVTGEAGAVGTASMTLQNTGAYALTNLQVVSSNSNVVIANAPTSLAVAEIVTLQLTITLPSTLTSGTTDLAVIMVKDLSETDVTKQLIAEAKVIVNSQPKFYIDEVNFDFGDEDDTIKSNGDTADGAKPGDSLSMSVNVKNDFDFDLEDVTVDVTFYELGEDEDDFDGDENEKDDIRAGKDREFDMDLDEDHIGEDIDEGTYTVEITINGEDEDGTDYTDSWTIYIDVQLNDDLDLVFTKAEVYPTIVTCEGSILLTVEGNNRGDEDDDDGRFVIKSTSFPDFFQSYADLEMGSRADGDNCNMLDEDDECYELEYSERLSIPANTKPGTYYIDLFWYSDGSDLEESTRISFSVKECSETTTSGSNTQTTTSPSKNTGSELIVNGGLNDGATNYVPTGFISPAELTDESGSFTESPLYFMLLGLLVVGALGGIVVLAGMLNKN